MVHLLAVILFLGNIILGLFWMRSAVKTKDLSILSFTMKSIILADKLFTIPGVLVITAGGILAAYYGHLPIWKTGWIFWSIVMFSISGLAFGVKIAPLQKKIYQLLVNRKENDEWDWSRFGKLYKSWEFWGLIATLAPLAAFAMMTLKVPH